MLLQDLYINAQKELDDPLKNIDLLCLIEKVFNISKEEFFTTSLTCNITDSEKISRFKTLVSRRAENEPLSYITNEKEFYSRKFHIEPGVLIPRPETEFLIEESLKYLSHDSLFLDIGSGSGIISVTLCLEAECRAWATDISETALRISQTNASLHSVSDRIKFINTDLFPEAEIKFNAIISNPPYIPENEWENLENDVKIYEPKTALTSGRTGLEIIERIISEAGNFLHVNCPLIMETGYNQSEAVKALYEEHGYTDINIIRDFSGWQRVISGIKK